MCVCVFTAWCVSVLVSAALGYYHAAAAAAAIDPRMRLATMAPFYDPYTMSMMRQPMGMTSGQDRNAGKSALFVCFFEFSGPNKQRSSITSSKLWRGREKNGW